MNAPQMKMKRTKGKPISQDAPLTEILLCTYHCMLEERSSLVATVLAYQIQVSKRCEFKS